MRVGVAGSATALSLVERGGTSREIVLVDRNTARADGVAADLRYAAPLSPTVDVCSGGYHDLVGVEPMTCAPDAFNSGEGILTLQPGETHQTQWGIEPYTKPPISTLRASDIDAARPERGQGLGG